MTPTGGGMGLGRTTGDDMTTTVYYIVGAAHSGSTLCAALLDEVAGNFAAAELRLAWSDLDHRRCGCGRLLRGCPVWARVLHRAAEHAGLAERDLVAGLRRWRVGVRDLPGLLVRARTGATLLTPGQRRYADLLARVYQAIAEVTGAIAVVDSSKSAAEVMVLGTVPGLRVHAVHLVRDPRAVVYSGFRSATGKPFRRDKLFVERAARYVAVNALAEAVARHLPRCQRTLVRYEDLVADPERELRRILYDAPPHGLPVRGDVPETRHMVGGNDLRFGEGPISVRSAEQAWQRQLPRSSRLVTSLVTHATMRRYGYGDVGRASDGDGLGWRRPTPSETGANESPVTARGR